MGSCFPTFFVKERACRCGKTGGARPCNHTFLFSPFLTGEDILIAETLYKSKEIEKWGSGLKRIYGECRLNGVKVEFETLKSGSLVVFHRDLAIVKTETAREDGGINSLLAYVKNNPGKRTVDIANGSSISLRTAEICIKKLKEDGKIEFRGSKKTGGYYLTEDSGLQDSCSKCKKCARECPFGG